MRGALAISMILPIGVGCGGGKTQSAGTPDAPPTIDAAPTIDAPPACQPTPLLVGGTDVTQQGWKVISQQPATLTNGADFVQLTTSTVDKASSGGQLLLSLAGAVSSTEPFKIAIVMKILSISPHTPDPLDAGVAIMPSLTGAVGDQNERAQMISIESTKISCADGQPTANVNLVDGAFHTYTLAVDADHIMSVSIDDQTPPVLVRKQAVTINGTIAIGDQTNDANFDSSLQIRSITKLCL
jgi:hypothetical protein